MRAAERYVEKGFLARARSRWRSSSPRLEPRARRSAPRSARAAEAPGARRASARSSRRSCPRPAAAPVPAPDAREDSRRDEVRFTDLDGPSSLDIVLEDVEEHRQRRRHRRRAPTTTDVARDIPVPMSSDRLPPATEPSIDRLGAMATFRLFAGLSREALLDLAEAAELVELIPGAMMMMRNEPAYALYAIIDGVVRVTVRGSPEIRLGEGDVDRRGLPARRGRAAGRRARRDAADGAPHREEEARRGDHEARGDRRRALPAARATPRDEPHARVAALHDVRPEGAPRARAAVRDPPRRARARCSRSEASAATASTCCSRAT